MSNGLTLLQTESMEFERAAKLRDRIAELTDKKDFP